MTWKAVEQSAQGATVDTRRVVTWAHGQPTQSASSSPLQIIPPTSCALGLHPQLSNVICTVQEIQRFSLFTVFFFLAVPFYYLGPRLSFIIPAAQMPAAVGTCENEITQTRACHRAPREREKKQQYQLHSPVSLVHLFRGQEAGPHFHVSTI